jgi:hypothetical protein
MMTETVVGFVNKLNFVNFHVSLFREKLLIKHIYSEFNKLLNINITFKNVI